MTALPTLEKDGGDPWVAAVIAADPAAEAGQRAALYDLLASLFRDQPGTEILRAFRAPPFRAALDQAGMELDDAFHAADIDFLADSLAVDFASLFLLPGRLISPHESVQVKDGSGMLRGPETALVRAYYEHVGFAVDGSTFMEPDHISMELEFLGHLSAEESNAWRDGARARALDLLRYQDDFLRRHLGRWAFAFLGRVKEASGTTFYRRLADLASAFLRDQMDALPSRIDATGDENAAADRDLSEK